MVYEGELFCPVCGGTLKLYDHVMRMIKIQKGVKTYIYIRRLRCTKCGRVHRELPEHIIPHIHYDKAIVMGNCITLEDTNGNRKLYKRKREHKIDCVAAMMDAFVAWKEHKEEFE